MPADLEAPARLVRKARKSMGERLREALQKLAKGHAIITRHDERAWASITFSGARHRLHLAFAGCQAIAAGETFIAQLPEHEFTLPGQLVADAAIARVETSLLPDPRMTVECELLLLEDA